MAIAAATGGVVINADSAQVYAELRVLSARPSPEDEARVPHRLYGVLPAAERCSAGRWLALATRAIADARSAGLLPLIVGGTGLYLRALTHGLAPVPPVPAEVRTAAQALYDRIGAAAFREVLRGLDPEAAGRLPQSDRQRLLRAYEVAVATGHTLGAWQRRAGSRRDRSVATVLMVPPREALYPALDARFHGMIAAGAVEEVRALLALGLDPALPAMKALGVRELAAYLRNELPLASAVAAAQQATRRFAKRQMTWFRHQVAADAVFFEQYSERILPEMFSFIRGRGLTPSA